MKPKPAIDTTAEIMSPDDPELASAAIDTWAAGLSIKLSKMASSTGEPKMRSVSEADLIKLKEKTGQQDRELEASISWLREMYERQCGRKEDPPKRPLVGHMVHILTQGGSGSKKKISCSGTEVFLILLTKFSHECSGFELEKYIKEPRFGFFDYRTDQDPGRHLVNSRLTNLVSDELCRKARVTKAGKAMGFELTERGKRLFNGWPTVTPRPPEKGRFLKK